MPHGVVDGKGGHRLNPVLHIVARGGLAGRQRLIRQFGGRGSLA